MTSAQTAALGVGQRQYDERIRKLNLAPLWGRHQGLMTRELAVKSVPYVWPYAGLRELLLEVGERVTAEEAERRVLLLENPAYEGAGQATETLVTGLQLLMPGEAAPAHRHTPNDRRLILEGEGAYTTVKGERIAMNYGDILITPSWSWHDHGHEGTEPVIWQDIVDLPLVRGLGPMFNEGYEEDHFPPGPPEGDCLRRYGSNMRPIGLEPDDLNSPVFSYPYAKSREAMEALAKSTDLDPYHGLKMELINPTTGGPVMSSISTFLQRLPKGFRSERYQSTEGAIFTCIEGKGRALVGDGTVTLEFSEKDIFVLPCWCPYRLDADEDTYLAIGSDKIVQTKLGLWRERRDPGVGKGAS